VKVVDCSVGKVSSILLDFPPIFFCRRTSTWCK
jgi:hypothetical protein